MEGKIPMAARRHVTNKLRSAYARASKPDRGRILDKVIATTGMGRSTARRALTGPVLPNPGEQIDRRRLRAKQYSDDSRALLEHVWALMVCPCGKYLTVMLDLWLPLLRNSIGLSKAGDDRPTTPGVIEADTVAHCGPTLVGEFARTLTMTDLVTGWTENASIRNNASEFINHDVADWLQRRDIAQTRSRLYQKNDQATVESKNNHVIRKHAFRWRYDTPRESSASTLPT